MNCHTLQFDRTTEKPMSVGDRVLAGYVEKDSAALSSLLVAVGTPAPFATDQEPTLILAVLRYRDRAARHVHARCHPRGARAVENAVALRARLAGFLPAVDLRLGARNRVRP